MIGLATLFWLFLPLMAISARAFDYFEHKFIGDKAFEEAKKIIGSSDLIEAIQISLKYKDFEDTCEPEEIIEIGKEVGEPQDEAIENCRILLGLPVTFGDFSALAGDHFQVPDLMLDGKYLNGDKDEGDKDKKQIIEFLQAFNNPFSGAHYDRVLATRRQWMKACQWYREEYSLQEKEKRKPLKDCFNNLPFSKDGKLLQDVGEEKNELEEIVASKGYEPSRSELRAFENLDDYGRLASYNKKHFPRHSWYAFLLHKRALVKAHEFGESYHPSDRKALKPEDKELLFEAILWESLAQHFLHDSFASGHIGSEWGWCTPYFTILVFSQ